MIAFWLSLALVSAFALGFSAAHLIGRNSRHGSSDSALDAATRPTVERDNEALRNRLSELEHNLEGVTADAQNLVTELRANEEQWAQAESIRTRVEQALTRSDADLERQSTRAKSLQVTNAQLTRQLQRSEQDLAAATGVIESLRGELDRRTNSTIHRRLELAISRAREIERTAASRIVATSQHAVAATGLLVGQLDVRTPRPEIDIRDPGPAPEDDRPKRPGHAYGVLPPA